MLKWFVGKQIDKFENEWGYDASYLREILDEGGLDAAMAVNGVTKLGAYRKDVPAASYYGAGIASVRQADCGPCTQLVVTMAERAGVDKNVLRAIVAGDRDAMPADVRLTHDYALASLAHDASAEAMREQILAKWGKRALISIAYAITSGLIYPTLKYALGHGRACVRVRVGNEDVAVAHPEAAQV